MNAIAWSQGEREPFKQHSPTCLFYWQLSQREPENLKGVHCLWSYMGLSLCVSLLTQATALKCHSGAWSVTTASGEHCPSKSRSCYKAEENSSGVERIHTCTCTQAWMHTHHILTHTCICTHTHNLQTSLYLDCYYTCDCPLPSLLWNPAICMATPLCFVLLVKTSLSTALFLSLGVTSLVQVSSHLVHVRIFWAVCKSAGSCIPYREFWFSGVWGVAWQSPAQ